MTNVNLIATTSQSVMSYPWWVWLIFGVCAVCLIVIGIWAVNKIVKIKKIGGLEFGDDKKDDIKHPHANCIHRSSLMSMLNKYVATYNQAHDLRSRGILARQMIKVEEYILAIKDISLTTMSTKMSSKVKDGIIPTRHSDYLYYKLVLQEFLVRIKDVIRAACINNGFVDMDTKRYESYLDDMCKRIGSMAARFFDENYIGTEVSLDDVFDKDYVVEMDKIVRNMFDTMRTIAENEYSKIRELEGKIAKIEQQELGIDAKGD